MEVKASLKYLNISPRKTRLVAGLLKGMSVSKAEAQLQYNKKRGSEPMMKLLKSAVSNAENTFHLTKDNLFIKLIRVDEGPALKRFRPRAKGAVNTIKKRTSHIYITLAEIKPSIVSKETIKKEETASHPKESQEKEKNIKETNIKRNLNVPEKTMSKQVLTKQRMFRRKAI
ncbi:MAG: 50S ribosomal protein L22 [Minisyncoccia bacterium]